MPTVLLVDDYTPNLVALECVLLPLQYAIVCVRCGRGALEILAATDIDVILTDHHMGDISGTELIRRVRAGARNQHVPIVLISGIDADDTAVRTATALPGVLFIQKPYRGEYLRARVCEVLQCGEAA